MINKVFFSTIWDLYFLWKYEWKNLITPNSFEEIVKTHLSLHYDSKGVVPEIKEPINVLFNQIPSRDIMIVPRKRHLLRNIQGY